MSTNYLDAVLQGANLVTEVALAYQNPNDPTDKSHVASTACRVLVDLGVGAGEGQAPLIGALVADAVEAAAGGSKAPDNVLNDLHAELQKHHLAIPAFADYFLKLGVAQAVAALTKVAHGGK